MKLQRPEAQPRKTEVHFAPRDKEWMVQRIKDFKGWLQKRMIFILVLLLIILIIVEVNRPIDVFITQQENEWLLKQHKEWLIEEYIKWQRSEPNEDEQKEKNVVQ